MSEQATAGTPMQTGDRRVICGAKTRSGGLCQSPPVKGSRRCRMHGGTQPVGPASPNFKTGRYSKLLPKRMAATYAQAQADGELLALKDEIALLDSRLADVLGRVDTGESSRLWTDLQFTWGEMQAARRAEDAKLTAQKLNDVGRLIAQGTSDYAAWADVRALIDQRRRLVESERKRLVEMQQMMTTERAMVLLSVVIDTVRKHVTDRDALQGIATDIRALVAG